MRGLLLTGSDTGVGKTYIACGLVELARNWGLKVGVMKPAESGSGDDALQLQQAAQSSWELELVCPYRLAAPLAPAVAAQQAGLRLDPGHIAQIYGRWAAEHDLVVVEGAGGFLVPLTFDYHYGDLARDLDLQVLLVVGSRLGALNQALLTFEAIQRRGLNLAGYVLNHPYPGVDEAVASNAQALGALSDVACLGIVPHGHPRAELAQVLDLWRLKGVLHD